MKALSFDIKPRELLNDDRLTLTGFDVSGDEIVLSVENWHGDPVAFDFGSLRQLDQKFIIDLIEKKNPALAGELAALYE